MTFLPLDLQGPECSIQRKTQYFFKFKEIQELNPSIQQGDKLHQANVTKNIGS